MSEQVLIREVGPRDGFQNEPEVIATGDKVRLIDMLARTGLRRLEVTSFVRPDVIPQLADGAEVLTRFEPRDGVAYSVLIPNRKGLENALKLRDRFQEANFFLSASETHNRKNVNRTIAESLADLEGTISAARDAGLRCEGVISTSFGCPYEGEVPSERVFEIAKQLKGFGCEEIAFGDTTGMANPRQVGEFFAAARERLGGAELTAHFHNTRGQGLANVLAALEQLPEGQVTVGFEVCVKHVAGAVEGAKCEARATLKEVVDDRKLRFEVEVTEGDRTIGVGTHERRVINPG